MFCSLHMAIFYLQINKNSKQEEKIARMFLAFAKLRAEHAKSQSKAIKILLHKQLQKGHCHHLMASKLQLIGITINIPVIFLRFISLWLASEFDRSVRSPIMAEM